MRQGSKPRPIQLGLAHVVLPENQECRDTHQFHDCKNHFHRHRRPGGPHHDLPHLDDDLGGNRRYALQIVYGNIFGHNIRLVHQSPRWTHHFIWSVLNIVQGTVHCQPGSTPHLFRPFLCEAVLGRAPERLSESIRGIGGKAAHQGRGHDGARLQEGNAIRTWCDSNSHIEQDSWHFEESPWAGKYRGTFLEVGSWF